MMCIRYLLLYVSVGVCQVTSLVICPSVYICVSCIRMQAYDSVYTAKLLVATPHLLAVPVSGATSDKLLVAVVSPAGACAASVRWKAVGD